MLRNMQELKSYTIAATDGDVGELTDAYFDDQSWVVRYMVIKTGAWLTSRNVLISPSRNLTEYIAIMEIV